MRIAILGWEEGLAGQVATWVESTLSAKLVCFVHPFIELPVIDAAKALDRPAKNYSFPSGGHYRGLPLLIGTDWPSQLTALDIDGAVCCLSDSKQREHSFLQASNASFPMLSAVHPSALLLAESVIAPGVIIEPQSYVGYRAEIGSGTHVHAGSQIDHHSVLGKFVTLNPRVTIAGNVYLGDHSLVNMGALISNRVELGDHTSVGAASTVLHSYPSGNVRLLGTPARPG